MLILSDDPATRNYGRSLIEVDDNIKNDKLRFKIKKAWLVKSTILNTDVKGDISKILAKFSKNARKTYRKYGFNYYAAERFMPRGGAGTVQGCEVIAMMLCLNVRAFKTAESRLLPAVVWKTQIKRYYDLKDLYKQIKPCPDHLLDATLIGLYTVYSRLKIKPFSTLDKKDIKYIITRLKSIGTRIKVKEDESKRLEREARKEEKKKTSTPRTVKNKKNRIKRRS
jgi:hypothetical protein